MKMKLILLLALMVISAAPIILAETPDSKDAPKLTAEKHGVEVARFNGNGDQTTKEFTLKSGPATFNAKLNWEKPDPELQNNEGDFSILLVSAAEKTAEKVIATIDHFDGARTIEVPADGNYKLQVVAPGNWEISIEQ